MSWPHSCIRRHEPLSDHTSFRIGGPAEWFAEPSTPEELAEVLRASFAAGLPVSIVGGGTNTLAADRGIRGLVVHLGRGFRTVQEMDNTDETSALVNCGAALPTQRLVVLAAKYGWDGVEILAGLPGQVGGAIAMNAQGIGKFVERVNLVSIDGTIQELTSDQLRFSYRYAVLPQGIIAGAVLRFRRVDPTESTERIRNVLQYRNKTQEVGLPSAGCAFKNPPGTAAGRLIDQAGLKSCRIGDAQVSSRHANFIVNLGQATCDDVLSLMEHVQHRVRQSFGVELEPEVRLVGERFH